MGGRTRTAEDRDAAVKMEEKVGGGGPTLPKTEDRKWDYREETRGKETNSLESSRRLSSAKEAARKVGRRGWPLAENLTYHSRQGDSLRIPQEGGLFCNINELIGI